MYAPLTDNLHFSSHDGIDIYSGDSGGDGGGGGEGGGGGGQGTSAAARGQEQKEEERSTAAQPAESDLRVDDGDAMRGESATRVEGGHADPLSLSFTGPTAFVRKTVRGGDLDLHKLSEEERLRGKYTLSPNELDDWEADTMSGDVLHTQIFVTHALMKKDVGMAHRKMLRIDDVQETLINRLVQLELRMDEAQRRFAGEGGKDSLPYRTAEGRLVFESIMASREERQAAREALGLDRIETTIDVEEDIFVIEENGGEAGAAAAAARSEVGPASGGANGGVEDDGNDEEEDDYDDDGDDDDDDGDDDDDDDSDDD